MALNLSFQREKPKLVLSGAEVRTPIDEIEGARDLFNITRDAYENRIRPFFDSITSFFSEEEKKKRSEAIVKGTESFFEPTIERFGAVRRSLEEQSFAPLAKSFKEQVERSAQELSTIEGLTNLALGFTGGGIGGVKKVLPKKVTPKQVKEIRETILKSEESVPHIAGVEEKLGLPIRGFESNKFETHPNLMGTISRGEITDSFVLIRDKQVADQFLEEFIKKANKKTEQKLTKIGTPQEDIANVLIAERKQILEKTQDIKNAPDTASLYPKEIAPEIAEFQGYKKSPSGILAFLSDGKNQVALDVDKIAFIKKQLPEAQFRINPAEESLPVQITVGNELKGLIMPVRGVEDFPFRITDLPTVTPEGVSAKGVVPPTRELPRVQVEPTAIREGLPVKKPVAEQPLVGDKPLLESISPQARAKAGITGEVLGEGKKVKSLDSSYGSLGKDATIVRKADEKLSPTKLEPEDFNTYQKFRKVISDKWESTREFVQDDWIRVKKLVERKDVKVSDASNPYDKEILFRGKVDTRIKQGKKVVKDIDDDIILTSRKTGITDTQLQDDVNQYLWARHAPERNAKLGDGAAGITTKEANSILKTIESSPHGKEVIRIANKASEFNKETLDILLEGGVIDKELHALLRTTYKNHVPLQRIFDETEAITDVLSGRGFDVRGTGLKRARGSEREVADILSNVTANYEQAVIRAEKNIVDNATLKFARDNKHLELFEEVKPPQIPVAKVSHREVVDVEFFEKVIRFAKSLGADVVTKGQPGRRLGFFAPPTKVTRAVATPREVLSHELGHFFDNKFGLKERFFKRGESKEVAQEMENWMKTIGESANRIRNTKERFADSFEWWLTNRGLAQEDLPLFSKAMEQIIKDIPTLKPLLDIRPSGRFKVQQIQELVFRPSVDALLRDPTILSLRELGKPVFLKINDPKLAVALRGVNHQKIDGLMRAIQSITRFYSGLATRFNPEFAFPNKLRDLQETLVYLGSKKEMGIKGAAKALAEERRSSKAVLDFLMGKNTEGARLYKQMQFDGGTTGGLGLSTRKQVELDIEKIRQLNRSKPRKAAEFFMERIDEWNTIFEDSTRLSVYRAALERGVSRQKAAVFAKEATVNFNKFGTGGPVINALYMFANASIQGSAKMLMAMKNPKVAGTVIAAVGTSVATIRQWNDKVDPDWREKVSKWDRLNSLPVILPSENGIKYVSIPVSWGMKPIKVAMDYAYDLASEKSIDIGEATESILASIIEGYNPIGGTDLLSAVTPTVLDLPVEVGRNKAWHGGMIKPDWDKNAPASIQFFGDLKESPAGQFFVSFTDKLSELSERRIEISPADIDYSYQQIIGGAGRTVSKTINTISAIGNKEIPPSREIPFASRFYRSIPEERIGAGAVATKDIRHILAEQSRERFNLNQMAEALYQEMKKLPKEEAAERFDELAKENPTLAKKISTIVNDERLQLTYTDRLIKQLGVENGERAKYLNEHFKHLKTDEERADLWDDLRGKRIISDTVAEQIKNLLEAQQ